MKENEEGDEIQITHMHSKGGSENADKKD